MSSSTAAAAAAAAESPSAPPPPPRYEKLQKDRTLFNHPVLNQNDHRSVLHQHGHTFVICADTQLGMTSNNHEWETELQYSRQAIAYINSLNDPRPLLFCCVCGDLVHMTSEIYANTTNTNNTKEKWTVEQCDKIQDEQNNDFIKTWDDLNDDIPLVCVCGNHDIGDHPNAVSIQRFTSSFGDDYLSFWANGTYNIVVNTGLFNDPTLLPESLDLYKQQLEWLESQLMYACDNHATHVFVFGHHPWFLYDENETSDQMNGGSPQTPFGVVDGPPIPDSYFHIPIQYRKRALHLFQKYNVTACFAGHFHQNLISRTEWGMDMIITGPLSVVLESTGIKPSAVDDDHHHRQEPKTRGVRVVRVQHKNKGAPGNDDDDDEGRSSIKGTFQHEFVSI